jgi:RNA polymerase sigma-70 factor, ECF subfamily
MVLSWRASEMPHVASGVPTSRQPMPERAASESKKGEAATSAIESARFSDELLRQAPDLYRLARRLTGNQADAEDLVQDTFSRALLSQAQYRPDTQLRAWVFRILRNAHIDRVRRGRVSPVDLLDDPDDVNDAPDRAEPLRGDRELEQLRRVVAQDIEAALGALSVDARMLVLLDHEGMTESELATVMGCASGTIKSRLSRARAALRRALAEYAR